MHAIKRSLSIIEQEFMYNSWYVQSHNLRWVMNAVVLCENFHIIFKIILVKIRPKSMAKRVRKYKSGHCTESKILVSGFLHTFT